MDAPLSRAVGPCVDPPVDADEQRRCVDALRKGDASALAAAYGAFRPAIFTYLLRVTRDRPLAEDLLQDTFLKFARAAPGLRPDTRLLPFLLVIARNSFLSRRREAVYDLDRVRELRLWTDEAATSNPDRDARSNEGVARIEQAIAGLPLPLREVLVLVTLLGVEPDDAALLLDLRPDNLRQRLHRARAMLKTRLEAP